MPSLNFKKQFADRVEKGLKKQTIRRNRKHPIKNGDPLYLFTGMRTSNCRRLRSTHCERVADIFIDVNDTVLLHNRLISDEEKHALAIDDGFEDFKQMKQFFIDTGGLPIAGQLIEWL